MQDSNKPCDSSGFGSGLRLPVTSLNVSLHAPMSSLRFILMWFPASIRCVVPALCLCLGLMGCVPSSQSGLDEQRDPHYIEGQRKATAMDFDGAIGSYHRALEVNPRSASAHFEIGVLYKRQEDYAAALYHLRRFVELSPNSGYADVVRQHIQDCKVEIAKTVSLAPLSASLQSEFDKLAEENRQLREENQRWRAYFARLSQQAADTLLPETTRPSTTPTPTNTPPRMEATAGTTPAVSVPRGTMDPRRTHVVRSGDTMYRIARNYRVKLAALEAANPGVNPSRLRPGQRLVIPSR